MKIKSIALMLALCLLTSICSCAFADYYHSSVSPTPPITATVSGVVSDAVDPTRKLADVLVTAGAVTTLTDRNGRYSMELTPGDYTLIFEKDGYISSTNVTALGNNQDLTLDVSLSRVLQSSHQYRVVLRWGATPNDLDSHLEGYSSRGSSYHVYFADKRPPSANGEANLDVDDTTSFGPETTTFTIDPTRNYVFYVLDYTNRSSRSSKAMSNSGAYVEVFCGNEQLGTYHIPTNKTGIFWTVFRIRNGVFSLVNEVNNTEPNAS